jgi:hypothetical protein
MATDENWRDFSGTELTGDAPSILDTFLPVLAEPLFVILIVAAVALSYRAVFSNHR